MVKVDGRLILEEGEWHAKITIEMDDGSIDEIDHDLNIPQTIKYVAQEHEGLAELYKDIDSCAELKRRALAEEKKDALIETYYNERSKKFNLDEFLETLLQKETTSFDVGPNSLTKNVEMTEEHKQELDHEYSTLVDTLNYVFKDIPKDRETQLPFLYLTRDEEEKLEAIIEHKHNFLVNTLYADYCKCAFLQCYVMMAYDRKAYAILQDEIKPGGILILFERLKNNFPLYNRTINETCTTESDNISKRKTHKSKQELIDNKFRSIYNLSQPLLKTDILKQLYPYCDSQEKLLNYCNKMIAVHKKTDSEENLLHPFFVAYDALSKRYEKLIKKQIQEHEGYPLGTFVRFWQFSYRERRMILYLYDLQKKYAKKVRAGNKSCDLRERTNSQEWTILSKEERIRLADLLIKLNDEDKTYRKYMQQIDPQEAEDKFLVIIAQLLNMPLYEANYQLTDMMNFMTGMIDSAPEEEQEKYEPVARKINEAYQIFLKIQKKNEISDGSDRICRMIQRFVLNFKQTIEE